MTTESGITWWSVKLLINFFIFLSRFHHTYVQCDFTSLQFYQQWTRVMFLPRLLLICCLWYSEIYFNCVKLKSQRCVFVVSVHLFVCLCLIWWAGKDEMFLFTFSILRVLTYSPVKPFINTKIDIGTGVFLLLFWISEL